MQEAPNHMTMFSGSLFHFLAGGVFSVLLVIACVTDVRWRRIPNALVLVLAALGLAYSVWMDPWWPGLGRSLGGLSLGFAIWIAFFVIGAIGAGDVKLFAAAGLWVDLEHAALLIATVLIAGGLLALVFLLPRLAARRPNGVPWRERKKEVPYAVAIAMGALFFVALQHQVSARHSNPLEFHPLELTQNS